MLAACDCNLIDFFQGKEELAVATSGDKEIAAKQKQVMSIAYGPGKGILSTGFMLWMSGSSIQIFSLMMTGMALMNPVNAISNVNKTFSKYENQGIDLKIPKLIFLALQLLALGMALYKCSMMGLLPVTSADWTKYLVDRELVEYSGAPV